MNGLLPLLLQLLVCLLRAEVWLVILLVDNVLPLLLFSLPLDLLSKHSQVLKVVLISHSLVPGRKVVLLLLPPLELILLSQPEVLDLVAVAQEPRVGQVRSVLLIVEFVLSFHRSVVVHFEGTL